MNKLSSLSYGMLLSVTVVLSGCGGGGGSSGSKPVSSPPASSAVSSAVVLSSSSVANSAVSSLSSSVTPSSSSSLPATTKLDIHGMAVADALAGGEVIFTIGAQTYKTTIDDSLKYSIALDIPDHDINKPFTAIATGSGGDDWVQLAALYPSIAFLAEQAGSDKELKADEYFGVNITALTTAEYAEIMNKQLPHATDAERKSTILNLHPIRAMEQAAMVSRLLTDINISLPSETKTTLDYLLNASLAETHVEALRITDESELGNQISSIQQDALQVNLSPKKIVGKYLLEALYSQYLLTFNDDGTGQLVTGSINSTLVNNVGPNEVTASFTWTRKGSIVKLNFNDAVKYTVDSVEDIYGQSWGCNDSSTSINELCELRFDSIQLKIITEADYRYIANLEVYVEAVQGNTEVVVYEGAIESQLAKITRADDDSVVVAADLIGSEWISDKYNYLFINDGEVKQKNLLTGIETTSDWKLEDNHLILDGSDLWITHKEQGGFGVFYIDSKSAYRTSLFKRAVVNMAESDWIGRWNTFPVDMFSATYDVNADKTWRDGFEAQSAGNWARLTDHSQTALANASWRMIRDVVAIHGGKYYLNVCHGVEATPFIPTNCYLSVQEKSADFDTAIFWKSWSYPAFNEKITQKPLVSMWGYLFFEDVEYANSLSFRSYVAVASNKLFNSVQGTIVEMTSANANEIELCEYPLNQSCNESNKRKYERGVEVTLSIGAGGKMAHLLPVRNLDYGYFSAFRWDIDKVIIVPKGRGHTLLITPDAGYTIDTVSGCDGYLSGNEYYISPLTSTCGIVVNFKNN